MNRPIYTVVVHEAEEGGFWTEVPALPGTGSQGETRDEALAMTREAIDLILDTLTEDGLPIPHDPTAEKQISRAAVPA